MPLLPTNTVSTGQLALGGIAQGIKDAISTYRDVKQQKFDNTLKSAGLAEKGYQINPDTGELELTDSGQAKQQLGLLQNQQGLADFDKDSDVATTARKVRQGLLKQAGLSDVDLSGLSTSQMRTDIDPQLDTAAKLQATRAQRDASKENKNTLTQNKSLEATQQLLESARGNPAAAQAEKDIYAAQKANSLANLYGDPNNLNPQMVQLLQSEVAKIAQGGSPFIHELEGLDVKTMPKYLASAMQTFTNKPSAANAGEFVKQYQDYANQLTKDARQVIKDKYERVIESRKAILGPDNYQALKAQYLDRFEKAASASQGLLGAPTGNTQSHPQDTEAIQWAKQNPNDPRSAKILQLNGAQ